MARFIDDNGEVPSTSVLPISSTRRRLGNLIAPAYLWRYLAAAIACASLLAATGLPMVREVLSHPVNLSTPDVVRNASVQGTTVVLGPANEMDAEVAWEANIRPGGTYRIEIVVMNPEPLLPVTLFGDLYGTGYDNREQDFTAFVPSGVPDQRIVRTVSSGKSPPHVVLRLFHFYRGPIRILSVRVTEWNPVFRLLIRADKLALLLTLIGGVLCALRIRFGNRAQTLLGTISTFSWPLAIGVVSIVSLLTVSLMGPPVILADEFSYRAMAAAVATGSDGILAGTWYQNMPNRLYFAVYALSSFAHDSFAVARLINVLFLLLTLVTLWWLNERMGNPRLGVGVALAYGLGAFATYVAYFMPETMFAAAYVLAYVTAGVALAELAPGFALLSGAAFAGLVFIKPHGWAAIAALVTYGLIFVWRSGSARMSIARVAVVFTVAFAAAWTTLRALLPRPDIGAFGAYSGIGRAILSALYDPGKWHLILQFVLVHLLIVGSLIAPALYYGLRSAFQPIKDCRTGEERLARVTAGLASLGLVALIAMTAAFSAAIVGSNPSETADRLHMRYYSFAIPLVVIAFLAGWGSGKQRAPQIRVPVAIWIICCLGALALIPKYHPMMWDSPDLLFGGPPAKYWVSLFGALGIAVSVALRRRSRGVSIGVLGVYFAVSLIAGIVVRDMQVRWPDTAEDRAGRFVAALAEESRVPVLIVANLKEVTYWPFRVAAYAPTWARFTSSDTLSELAAGKLPKGTMVIVNNVQLLPGISLLARFGNLRIGRWDGT